MNISVMKKEDGFAARTCNACKAYVKIVDENLLGRMTPDIADLMSLPLDMVVQKHGFKRHAPNPIGMGEDVCRMMRGISTAVRYSVIFRSAFCIFSESGSSCRAFW